MFQSTVAPSADRFRGRRGGSMRIAFPSEDEVAAKDFIGFAALSRTLFPPLCSRIVLKTTLTAGGTPRQRRMERRPPPLTFFRSSLVTMRGRQSLTAPSLLSPCSLRSRLRRPMRHGGGEERKKRFAERSLRAALPHEGASGLAVDTCCLCGNERCRPCRSKGTRHAQSHQHNSATERFPLRGEVSNHKGIFDERTPAAVKRSRRVGCIRIRPARRPGGGEVAVRPGPGVKPASRCTGLAGRYFQT